jgi:formylmethanofuran dehydrogenase subunit E
MRTWRQGDKLPPKPTFPTPISEQRCDKCGKQLSMGDSAVIHLVNPVAFCIPCAGHQEPQRQDLAKAIVKGDVS